MATDEDDCSACMIRRMVEGMIPTRVVADGEWERGGRREVHLRTCSLLITHHPQSDLNPRLQWDGESVGQMVGERYYGFHDAMSASSNGYADPWFSRLPGSLSSLCCYILAPAVYDIGRY